MGSARKIHLNTACVDNAGQWRDAGTELTVGETLGEKGELLITRERADALLSSGQASTPSEAAESERVAARAAEERAPAAEIDGDQA